MIAPWSMTPKKGGSIAADDLAQCFEQAYRSGAISAAPPLTLEEGPGGAMIGLDMASVVVPQIVYTARFMTDALPSYTNENGTLTATGTGALTSTHCDGVDPEAGDVFLFAVEGQADKDYALYQLTQVGDGANPWIASPLSQSLWQLRAGAQVFVGPEGSGFANTTWQVETADPIKATSTDVQFGLKREAYDISGYRTQGASGFKGHYCPGSPFGNFQTTMAPTANTLYTMEFVLPGGGSLESLGIWAEANSGLGSGFKARIGLYPGPGRNGGLGSGASGELLWDSGDIVFDEALATFVYADAIARTGDYVQMPPGAYLLALVFNTSLPSVGAAKTANLFPFYGVSDAFLPQFGVKHAFTYGAMLSANDLNTLLETGTFIDGSVASVPVPFLGFASIGFTLHA